jgi:beta-fructofuranosidase
MNMDTLNFEHGDFQELDAGFDFYATQTMATPDGRRILTAWFGISELHYPTEQYHYTGSLVLPRELFVKNGRLIQKPIREVQSLRRDQQSFTLHATEEPSELRQATVQEVKAKIDMRKAQRLVIDLRANADNSKHTRLLIDKQSQSISLDRGDSGIELAEEYGTTRRRALLIRDRVTLDIFIDVSSVEIFVNDGQMVFSARIFPETDQTYTFITSEGGTTQLQGDSWLL